MRRFWTYVGAVLPLAATAEYANGSVDPNSAFGQRKFPGRSDAVDTEEDGAAGGNGEAEKQDSGQVASAGEPVGPGDSSALESGDDAVTQEIKGLLKELDRMNDSAEINSSSPAPVYGPASSEMYLPESAAGMPSSGGASLGALAEEEQEENEDDISEDDSETGTIDEETDDEVTDTENAAGEGDSAEDTSGEPGASDVDSMLVLLGGTAGGAEGTMTDGDIDLEVVDYGQVTVAYGKAEFIATSEWDGTGQPPEAYAETFLDVYDADLVFFYHADEEAMGEDGSYSESSTLYVVAVDFEDDHPLANEFDMSDDNGFEHEFDPGLLLAAYDGTPESGYFSHPLLDGIPFGAFSQYYGDANGEVHLDDTGSDINFVATTLDGSEDSVVLVGDTTAIEDLGSSATLIAQTDHNGLDIAVSGIGPDSYTSIDGQIFEVEGEFSGITGLAIGIA
jgi:hypothetical protein